MTYSLINMPVLGYDLCRLPRGAQVAGVLLSALALEPADLAAIAREHPGAGHRVRWQLVQRAGDPRPSAGAQLRAVGELGRDLLADPPAVLHTLERVLIGDLDDLDRMLRNDVLDWTCGHADGKRVVHRHAEAAADVIAEALASEYCNEVLPSYLAELLREPWAAAAVPSRPVELGPHAARIHAVLDAVRGIGPDDAERLRGAVGDDPQRLRWSAAVHDASWAIFLTGRIRAAAAAQLLAVQAFAASPLTASDAALGTWNLVSGVVHGLVADDILAGETAAALRGGWAGVLGPV